MADNPTRKLLFVVFSDDTCRQNHALMYALDFHAKGYDVRIILDGPATQALSAISNADSRTGELLRRNLEAGLLAGACARASAGCATGDPERDVVEIARTMGIPLLSDMEGHAGVESFVREGYEIVAL